MPVSAVIPTLNEEAVIAETIRAARAAGIAEVVVSDGGSSDRTLEIARAEGARIVVGESVRARQLNRGAAEATHEAIVFLHADTLLPGGAAEAVEAALRGGAHFGGFRLAFLENSRRLRFVATMINGRTRLTRSPWGDQAQFTSRDTFARLGGYPDYPIMEDYELARRVKRESVAILPLTVRTSGRRFLRQGVLRTTLLNWLIITAYHLGVRPPTLARWYRGSRGVTPSIL